MSEASLKPPPLQGRRVLVTRTREQAAALSEHLRVAGAQPIELPVIRIVPPDDWRPLDQALQALEQSAAYDWLVFTSANGVRMVLERLHTLGLDQQILARVPVATIGPATAAELGKHGLRATLVPEEYIAESVAEALRVYAARQGTTLQGKRILLARAAEARQVLVDQLTQEGALVDVVAAYQTLPVAQDDQQGREVVALLRQQELDVITFTSSSTVHHFMHWLSQSAPDIAILLAYPSQHDAHQPARPLIACIGPITSATARSYGLEVGIEAREFTAPGLVEALIDHEEKVSHDRSNDYHSF
jgi:uroporphyrinogen-III synthase